MKYKSHLLLILYLLALISAIVITVKPVSQICSPQEGCDTVLNTKYAETFGIKTSLLGIIAISFTLIIIISQLIKKNEISRRTINFLTIIGGILALRLLYLQKFVIHSYCKYCLIVDISLVLAMIITIIFWKD
jgi:uncharacterized membrane protein